ncbi:MAG: cysteine--tRNA ligase [Planctomycetes bacterium]|nr:cysteine--tRNA ligase [Planctomycetota bacterium]
MPLNVYSTLSRKKEPFHKKPGEAVSMYVCGPTVYKPSHIGHMVGPVIFDTVKRYLTYLGYKVTFVVNITDVDDKLIVRAKELGTTVKELAEKMTADYLDCLKKLNVTGIDEFPRATDHIPGMIAMMERLIAKGYAYAAGGDVYFDISKDEDYGKLCNRDPEQLEAGSRIEVTDKKRNPGDFALWKGSKPGEPAWESPWGPGRPGWHIECSVMSQALLGKTLDIHGGGLDLQFPHHENELAQSESDTGVPFARFWMHNGLLKLKDKEGNEAKMAGSLGNVLNVADALKQVPGDVLRFFLLKSHYRTPIDLGIWDWKNPATPIPNGMVEARKAYQTFERLVDLVQRISGSTFADLSLIPAVTTDRPELTNARQRFREHMDDDFNTGGAVGVLFELVNSVNKIAHDAKLDDPAKANNSEKPAFLAGASLIKELAGILGLTFRAEQTSLGGGNEMIAGLLQLLIDLRNSLRNEAKKIASKDDPARKVMFDQTDVIRKRLAELGVTLEDRPGGTGWRIG